MDDKLRAAIDKRQGVTAFEEQFNKSFRKVFGITPEIASVDLTDGTVGAHGERWALDGHNWLLVKLGDRWVVATPEVFAKDAGGGQ